MDEDTVGVADMVLLDPMTEEKLMSNLKQRYQAGKIYTYIGDVVVSVNPYRSLPIYSTDFVKGYRSRNMFEMPPHIFSLADDAYRSMRDYNSDQCIIISGESGSGKTEASKIVMRYVAAVSGKGEEVDRVKEQLLQSNPVLEAFGNAKTVRNDNSSRFGKYMDLEFDYKGDPIGGVISKYLLEKSRVVHQAPDERNFHIFYQLLQGGSEEQLRSLGLERRFDIYNYLNQSGCTTVPSIDDEKNFKTVEIAMRLIGFKDQEIADAFKIVGAILHLGNVEYESITKDGMDTVAIKHIKDLETAARLLGTTQQELTGCLSSRTVHSGTEKVTTSLSPSQANYGRDALCKAAYQRLFRWLVSRINDSIRASAKASWKKCIGVLDIYGFEVFENNSFEQFIINYCNEKLQQLFIELTLKLEQEEYVREGIEWVQIDYFNNAVICELIEKPNTGIISLLDEECLRPGDVSDKTFLDKLNERCIEHPHYQSRVKNRSDTKVGYECFKLVHYAGDVTYDVENFIDKNNDLLYKDMSRAMYNCKSSLLKHMFPEGDPSNRDKRRPPTVGTQMKGSVSKLVDNLMSKRPHYIRCIKPNDRKSSSHFDMNISRHQARYLGLLENVRVRRAGYCYRQLYDLVLERYKMLSPQTWPNWRKKPLDGVKLILEECKVTSPHCAFGKTKLFIRDPTTVFHLEHERKRKIIDLVILMQKTIRGFVARHKYLKMRQSQIKISSQYRMYREKKKYTKVKNAVVQIQSCVRGYEARKLYGKKLRKYAGPKVVRFIRQSLAVRFLLQIKNNLPSQSPLDNRWPTVSKMFTKASDELRMLYHAWRCAMYRKNLPAPRKKILSEKLQASELFKDKKKGYSASVPKEFRGDHVILESLPAWAKAKAKFQNNLVVIFADHVTKIHRSNAKEVDKVLLLTRSELMVLNPKSLQPLYRITLASIEKISTSPHQDDLVVFHLREDKSNKALSKGDFVFYCKNLIELVAKSVIQIRETEKRILDVVIAESFVARLKGKSVDMVMHSPSDGGKSALRRKGSMMERKST